MGLHIYTDRCFVGNVRDGEMNFKRKHVSKCDEDVKFTAKKLMLQTDLDYSFNRVLL